METKHHQMKMLRKQKHGYIYKQKGKNIEFTITL